MTKKTKKKGVKAKANKSAQTIYDDLEKHWKMAQMDAVVYGIGFIAVNPEGGFFHIPMEALAKGEMFGNRQPS